MLFQSWNSHAGPLFRYFKILKCFDKNAPYSFISKSFESHSNVMVRDWQILVIFKFLFTELKPKVHTYSVIISAIYVWNHLESYCHNDHFNSWEIVWVRKKQTKRDTCSIFLTTASGPIKCICKVSIYWIGTWLTNSSFTGKSCYETVLAHYSCIFSLVWLGFYFRLI